MFHSLILRGIVWREVRNDERHATCRAGYIKLLVAVKAYKMLDYRLSLREEHKYSSNSDLKPRFPISMDRKYDTR